MQQSNTQTQVHGFIADVSVSKNEERGTLIHYIYEDARLELPIATYKRLLGVIQEDEISSATELSQQPLHLGLIVQPSVYLSKDEQYIVHRFLGMRISKHTNCYRKILGIPLTKKAQTA